MVSASLASVLLSLASAVSWGAGDFSGGIACKKTNVFLVVAVAHGAGLVLMVALALLRGEQFPGTTGLLWGGVAGFTGAIGLASLYKGLAVGKMGVVGPVAGVITAALPVIYGAAMQGLPKTVQLCGFGLAFVGIVLISKPERQTEGGLPRGLGLAVLAGLGFGLFLVAIRQAGTNVVFWPLASARVVSLLMMLGLLVYSGGGRVESKRMWGIMLLAGILDTLGNALFIVATQMGRLDVAAVLSSLYPAATVVLARVFLNERVTAIQNVGMVAALAAIPLIAW